MEFNSKYVDQVLVLSLSGELMGGPDTENFRIMMDETIKSDKPYVVVDFSDVSWMNSSGLGMLISALTTLRSSGGDLRLANLTERLRRPIQITKLDTVFQEFDTIDEAVGSFNLD